MLTTSRYTKIILTPKVSSALNGVKVKGAQITVHKQTPMKSSHEECASNPLIQKGSKIIIHPAYGVSTCDIPTCGNKACPTPCGPMSKIKIVGHGTHSDSEKVPGVVRLSETDGNNQKRPQYGKFYSAKDRPVPSNPEETLDPVQTKNINQNSELANNILMNTKFHD